MFLLYNYGEKNNSSQILGGNLEVTDNIVKIIFAPLGKVFLRKSILYKEFCVKSFMHNNPQQQKIVILLLGQFPGSIIRMFNLKTVKSKHTAIADKDMSFPYHPSIYDFMIVKQIVQTKDATKLNHKSLIQVVLA